MRTKVLISILIALTATTAALAALPQTPLGYALPFYTIKGRVSAPAGVAVNSRTVIFYAASSAAQRAEAVTNADGEYELNVYDLYYGYATPIDLSGATYSYKIGVLADANNYSTEETISLVPTAGYLTKDLTLAQQGGGNGPVLSLALLPEGFYDQTLPGSAKPFTVEVEARSGGATADTASSANLAGRCLATFDPADGKVKNNGWWQTVPPDGDYYLVIKLKLAGVAAGSNHLGIMTQSKFALNRVAGTLALDLTAGSLAYKPAGTAQLEPLKTVDGKKMMWLGDFNGDNNITEADSGLWLNTFNRFRGGQPASDTDPQEFDKADFNRDGFVTEADGGIWLNNFQQARPNAAPHAHIPE